MSGGSFKIDDLWNSYKELKSIVWKHLNDPTEDLTSVELENVLSKHKQTFCRLLENPSKNAKSREDLKKGMVEGVNVKGICHQIISQDLYQEAIILSDMYDLNEFVALDMLCTAQIQMPYYPSLPRGLVAVLLYYDCRKALVNSLLYLVQARTGIQWCIRIKPDVARFITEYTDQLLEDGLFNNIFQLLKRLDLTEELEKLQKNLALGGPKHRRQVTDLFNDIRVCLAEIVFTWASQCGLPKVPTISLINHLREVKMDVEPSGVIDDVNLYLEMALLSALDLSIVHTREDGEEAVQSLPILSDPTYIEAIIKELQFSKAQWATEGLYALSTFALAVCVSSLRDIAQNFLYQEAINKEEVLIDLAIKMNVFQFMHDVILENKTLYNEEFLYKRMHNLVSDFIFSMYPKVKDLKMSADDISRTVQLYHREGLEAPSSLPRHFEYLLLTVGKLYSNNVLKVDYVSNYWSPIEINPCQSNFNRAQPRSVSLFKFIKLAGDTLPVTLFMPYLKMLCGLSSSQTTARHCFNMLKQPGSHVSSCLSWDHFFLSFGRYYSCLRQETPLQTPCDTMYRNRCCYKGVSPQELDGLHAVLLLIRTIAEYDEFSRMALCEHPGWSPLSVMLGLVSCSVPIPFKADLLLTLAVLSKSSQNASHTWDNLEASQILATVPSTSSYSPRGIETELAEIESKMEEYPLTRAFLKLLDVLIGIGIPRTLGAGSRKPGFDPYLSFIVNSVFLKCNARSYRNSFEKWEVANLCLESVAKILESYEPKIDDFTNTSSTSFNSFPGFHLMIQLNTNSEFLNTILYLLDDGNKYFDTFTSFQGEEKVKECTLNCLNILQRALILQPRFFALMATSSSPLMLTSIYKLLLWINKRSGTPNHCLNIAKYTTYQLYLPRHALVAVKILTHVTNSSAAHNQLMSIFLTADSIKDNIKNGFVECLDAPCEDKTAESTKKEIIKLLKQCLSFKSPNFSHFLLGFDLKRDVSKTEFQFPGILGFARSCLHSILAIADSAITSASRKPSASLLESTYQLLYLLASNTKTSCSILRFVRLNKNFYKDHLKQANQNLKSDTGQRQNLNQMSWLMKMLAIELSVISQTKQITYLKQLTAFLVNVPLEDASKNYDIFSLIDNTCMERNITANDIKMENFLSSLMSHFELKTQNLEVPNWEFFDKTVLNQILESCTKKSHVGSKLFDLKKLHQILYDELKSFQGTAVMGQVQAITQEIPKVLKYALDLNTRTETSKSVTEFVNAWRQVVEVLVTFTPLEILSTTEQQIIGIYLLKDLLKNVVKAQHLPEVSRLLSGSVLLMMSSLKTCHAREKKLQQIGNATMNINILKLYYSSFKEILERLVEWIMVSDVVDNELRINLYSTLVTFLQLSNTKTQHKDICADDSVNVSRLDSSTINVTENVVQIQFSTDILSTFGEKLIEIMCQDCIGGQEICKILAMSSFSHLVTISGNLNWITYISSRGYLKNIIQSILASDKDLKNMLESHGGESVKPLYLYQAKILLLARFAGTRVGAELILEQKLLSCFSNMSVFNIHPEISKSWKKGEVMEDFLPPVEQRYLQLWLPIMEICNTILTTLGTDNQSVVEQIMYLFLSHLDIIELILRSGCPDLSQMFLKELSLLTFVLARTANNDLINVLNTPNIVQNVKAQLHRLQKLMLSLMPKFILSEETVKRLTSHPNNAGGPMQTSARLLYAMQTMANLLCYARNVVANQGIEHDGVGVLFHPSLNDPLLMKFKNTNTNGEEYPSLGVVVQQLMSAVSHHQQEKFNLDMLMRKLKEIPDMNSVDLRYYVDESMEMEDISKKREKAFEIVSRKLSEKTKEINYCSFIIENALYLIWMHLDFFLLKAIPKPRIYGYLDKSSQTKVSADATLSSASEATWKVSVEVLSNLKQGLISLFNDSFSKQLVETAQDRTDLDKEFIEALLRKIKRLVQFAPVK